MIDKRKYISSHISHISCLCLAIALISFGCARRADLGQQIVFAPKAFGDSAQTGPGEGSVYISGTLSGVGVPYKNNTVAITCYKDRMKCLTYSVAQIGPNQISRLDSPASYPVTKWDTNEIIATGSADSVNCRQATITILRKSETAVWVEEPLNQASAACKNADTRILKWTIEDSPGWTAVHKNNK